VWRGFVFDPGAYKCQCIKCPCRGSRYGGGEPMRSSSEAGPHPRGRPALERDGTSPEGASGPRARRNLTQGGDRPSSEAGPRARQRPALERGGTSPKGATVPRARRRFTSVVSCPSSEAKFRPRVAGPTVWRAAGATRAMGS
jgi:hypothetical protein